MSAPRWRVAGAALALSFACGQADREDAAAATPFELTPAPVRAPSVALGDGHEVINLADSFLRYASAA